MLSHITAPNQEQARQRELDLKRDLLRDASVLLSVRWNMEVIVSVYNDDVYAYGVNTRFNVGQRTIENALGDLTEHVDFLRSAAGHSLEDLVAFVQCKAKWRVPEQVTESSSGWEARDVPETSGPGNKRRRI
ncbi:nonstructural protein 3 [Galliform chaphamaparvovirus 13]|nr:nonstructural protein 3 [Galliform chaphamaparvovirus 13]